jgi:hypothetical protein
VAPAPQAQCATPLGLSLSEGLGSTLETKACGRFFHNAEAQTLVKRPRRVDSEHPKPHRDTSASGARQDITHKASTHAMVLVLWQQKELVDIYVCSQVVDPHDPASLAINFDDGQFVTVDVFGYLSSDGSFVPLLPSLFNVRAH